MIKIITLSELNKIKVFLNSCRQLVIRLSFSVFIGTILLSCDDSLIDESELDSDLVVEAYIDSDGFPMVILSTSLVPSYSSQGLAEHIVRWGKVTISDGVDTVIMTGGVDKTVFPPFSYRTYYMKGVEGSKYTIDVEYKDKKAHSVVELLRKPKIESWKIDKVENTDSLYSISVKFSQPNEIDTCYYVAFTRVVGKDNRFLPSFLGTLKCESPKSIQEISVFRGKDCTDANKYEANFKLGEVVDVMIARVSRIVYDFWTEYQNQVNFSHTIFIQSSVSIEGNIEGGYGCFTARSSSVVRIPIEP